MLLCDPDACISLRVRLILENVTTAYFFQAVIDTVNATQELEFDDLTEMMQNTSRFVDTFGKFQVNSSESVFLAQVQCSHSSNGRIPNRSQNANSG